MGITGGVGLFVGEVVQHQRCGGLLSVVQGPYTPTDVHWQGGLEFDDSLCAHVNTTLNGCDLAITGTPPVKNAGDCGEFFRSVDPFTIYAQYKCSTGGVDPLDGFEIARQRLIFNEHKGVEKTFWTGVTPAGNIEPSLAFGDPGSGILPFDITPAGGAVDIVTAVGMMEAAMTSCIPGQGVLHANVGIGAYLAQNRLITSTPLCIGGPASDTAGTIKNYAAPDDKKLGQMIQPADRSPDLYPQGVGALYTPLGNQWALGSGYPTSGPNNIPAPPGEVWIFGTGPVIAWRSEIFMTPPEPLPSGINRQNNDQEYFAERTWALGWSCCSYAIRAKISACLCGC